MIQRCILYLLLLFALPSISQESAPIIAAYLGSDTPWSLPKNIEKQLINALKQVDIVFYAFVRIVNNTFILTEEDKNNLIKLKNYASSKPIMLSIGGWGGRDEFGFLASAAKRQKFVSSCLSVLLTLRQQGHNVAGIDIDWENEQLASSAETEGLKDLFKELHSAFNQVQPRFLLTNAVPASPAYWANYPEAKEWSAFVDYTIVMAYDHYGTFGSTTKLGAGLYRPEQKSQNQPEIYSETSADDAIVHYKEQGLVNSKILLGIPFYCHSYYIDLLDGGSPLDHKVYDPNISSQIDYAKAFALYKEDLFKHTVSHNQKAFASYGVISVNSKMNPALHRFISCESPETIKIKMKYIKENQLGGTAFWSLLQDLPYQNQYSLLRAIHQYLN